jgi:hypothetical protein
VKLGKSEAESSRLCRADKTRGVQNIFIAELRPRDFWDTGSGFECDES